MGHIDDDQLNVFEMFVAHGGAGFWVRRTTWGGTCARVVRVGALTGPPPYFGNPSVIMDVYGLDGKLRDDGAQLPVPGTYKTWRQIDPPEWTTSQRLRPLDDPILDQILFKLDRKRNKLTKPEVERIVLTVPFERKDKAKAIGAKWDPTARTWWIRADDLEARSKAIKLDFLKDDAA
jgi:hypothetical protein